MTIHIGLFLDIGQVSTGGLSANNSVGLSRKWGLVDRAIPKAPLIFTFAIGFWENMMDTIIYIMNVNPDIICFGLAVLFIILMLNY